MCPTTRNRLIRRAGAAVVFTIAPLAPAVITYTGDNPVNSVPVPGPGNVANYEGYFYGGFGGTTISPTILATATHVTPGPNTTFVFYNGTSTATTYQIQQVATLDDLALWEIAPNQTATFSTYAPIYTSSSEVGSTVLDLGTGYQVGGPNYTPGTSTQDGWTWAGGQGSQYTWGTNTVSQITTGSQIGLSGAQGGPYLQLDFNPQNTSSSNYNPNESILTPFDSGGGGFILSGGQYELAGINTSSDEVLTSNGTAVSASLWDTYGYYTYNSQGQLVQITTHSLPESSFLTRVSTKQNLIGVVTGSIGPSSAAAYPVNDDSQLAVYQNMTTGAVIGGGQLIVGSSSLHANLHIAPNSGASQFSNLSIAIFSQLDISNNSAIIKYSAGSDPISTIAAWISSGYANGAWNGYGIISTNAQTNSGSYGIGYADSADPGNPAGLTGNEIEIKYTLLGDANLDGKVNGADFAILAANFNKSVTGSSGWDQGDFNYDGKINGADFAFLAANFNKAASQSAADLAALNQFAATNDLLTSVPEPTTSVAMLLFSRALLTRRQRREQSSL